MSEKSNKFILVFNIGDQCKFYDTFLDIIFIRF